MKRVVLVRTQGPRNAGLAARAAANFGPAELWFAAPERADLLQHKDFSDMAHGVADLAFPVTATLGEALAECTYVAAFTARGRRHRAIRAFRPAEAELAQRAADPSERVALLFGCESYGLSEEELESAAEVFWIETSDAHRSLNLGAAVAIVLRSLFREERAPRSTKKFRPLAGADRALLLERFGAELPRWLDGAVDRADLAGSIERLFGRAALETRDARAWHRLLRALAAARSGRD